MELFVWVLSIVSGPASEEVTEIRPMEPLGWVFLIVSLSFVWGLTGWCFYRVLTYSDEHSAEPPAD